LQFKMFEARLVQGNLFKKVLELLEGIQNAVTLDAATLDCSDTGIQLQAMDASHVSLVSVHLRADGFSYYRCDRPLSMGMKLGSMSMILRCAADEDTITLKAEDVAEAEGVINFMFESPNQEKVSYFDMKFLKLDQEHLGFLETVYSAVIKMPSGEFERVVRDLSQFEDSVVIACSRKGVNFSATSDLVTKHIMIAQTDNVEREEEAVIIEMQKPIILTVSHRYLAMFTRAGGLMQGRLGGQVSLCINSNVPLLVEYTIGKVGHLKYILAPRIVDEDMELKDVKVKTETLEEGGEVNKEYIEGEEVVKFKKETVLEGRLLQEENRKLQEENRKLKNENETLKLKKSEQEENNEGRGEGRVDGQNNEVGGDEDEKKKTDAVKSKAVKRKTELIKTSYAKNEDDQDENQNDGGFSQDGRPDPPEG